jgi:ricin-type beta-trefoil lectin protein
VKVRLRLAAVAALAVATVLGGLAFAAPASAATDVSGTWNYRHVQNGYCLDSNKSFAVYMGACNGGAYQLWSVTIQDDGTCIDSTCYHDYYATLKDVATGYCLDGNSTQLYTHVCNGDDYQAWHVGGDSSTNMYSWATGKCLDGSGTSVYVHECNAGNAYQQWQEGAWS